MLSCIFVCPLPSCYPIIVSVAPPVSLSLPSFVSLYSLLVSEVLCRSVCFMFACPVVCCLPVFPLQGGFCFSLFYFVIKNISPAFGSSSRSLTERISHMRTQQRKGLCRPPPATISSPLYQCILQFEALSSCHQQGNDVRKFAVEFNGAAEGLGYNEVALKDLFNSRQDSNRGQDHLTCGEFGVFGTLPR